MNSQCYLFAAPLVTTVCDIKPTILLQNPLDLMTRILISRARWVRDTESGNLNSPPRCMEWHEAHKGRGCPCGPEDMGSEKAAECR